MNVWESVPQIPLEVLEADFTVYISQIYIPSVDELHLSFKSRVNMSLRSNAINQILKTASEEHGDLFNKVWSAFSLVLVCLRPVIPTDRSAMMWFNHEMEKHGEVTPQKLRTESREPLFTGLLRAQARTWVFFFFSFLKTVFSFSEKFIQCSLIFIHFSSPYSSHNHPLNLASNFEIPLYASKVQFVSK